MTQAPPYLIIRDVTKRFPVVEDGVTKSRTVLESFSLTIAKGETVALFGPNGCGKSTLLNLIAGLEEPDEGEIHFLGDGGAAGSIGYAFQHFADSLFPWQTVLDNVALKFAVDGMLASARRSKAEAFATEFGISLPWDAYPYQLSSGQKQLVALLRTMAYRPGFCLLDEPLSALDFQNALNIMNKLSANWEANGTTVLMVSHDIEQAICLADRVVVLTRLPMRAKMIIDVRFPKPRTVDVLQSGNFLELRKTALNAFVEEVKK